MIKPALGLVVIGLALPSIALAADYAVITRTITVAHPADVVWRKVGDFCGGISAFLKVSCTYASGAGNVGTVRRLNGGTEEVMIARTSRSYAYQQTAGSLAGANYHGSLDIEPSTDGKASSVVYTVIYDTALLPPERRASTEASLTRLFQNAVEAIKTISEAD